MIGADSVRHGGETVGREQPSEPLRDLADEPRPAIDQRGVELDEARARADSGVGRLRRIDSAHPDQRQATAAKRA